MPDGYHGNLASESDRVTAMTCRCGTSWVRESRVQGWYCPVCRRRSAGETITLGKKGRLP